MDRLYRSRDDRIIGGVAAGIAHYLNIDPTLVRLAWIFIALLHGAGILLYFLAMIVIPQEPDYYDARTRPDGQTAGNSGEPQPGPSSDDPGESQGAPAGDNPAGRHEPHTRHRSYDVDHNLTRRYRGLGVLLVLAGVYLLANEFVPFNLNIYFWPGVLVLAGLYLIVRKRDGW